LLSFIPPGSARSQSAQKASIKETTVVAVGIVRETVSIMRPDRVSRTQTLQNNQNELILSNPAEYTEYMVLITLSAGLAQTNPVTPKGKDPSVRTVEDLLQQPSGFSSGFTEKQSDRLGDRVSIALLKIFNGNELEDPQNIRRFLPIIRSSFLYPNLIPTQYRKPNVTLPLLARLERRVADVKLKSEISAVAGFVKEQTRPDRVPSIN